MPSKTTFQWTQYFYQSSETCFSQVKGWWNASGVVYIDASSSWLMTPKRWSNIYTQGTTLLISLGFTIHDGKSLFVPPQRVAFWGFVLDSIAMRVSMKSDKAEKVKTTVCQLLRKERPQIRGCICCLPHGLLLSWEICTFVLSGTWKWQNRCAKVHPLYPNLRLIGCPVSGKHSDLKVQSNLYITVTLRKWPGDRYIQGDHCTQVSFKLS